MISLIDYKNEFSARQGIHFNNAGMAPVSKRVAERLQHAVVGNQVGGSLIDSEWVPAIRNTRKRLADFLNTDVEDVAFSWNTSQGISQAAFGFPLNPKDSVVTVDQEYASNYYPWKVACERSGAKLVVVSSGENKELSLEKLIEAIKPGVKLVGVSWVQFQTGSILDLKTLGDHCHSVGAYLVVDVIQGLGQIPFSLRDLPVDMVTGASHKWLCGTTGQGFFAVKKELRDLLNPLVIGSSNFNRFGTFADPNAPMETSARKFESGGIGYLPLFALDSALSLAQDAGVTAIAGEIKTLSRTLREGLLECESVKLVTPLDQVGGITSFRLPAEREFQFLKQCKEDSIAIVKRGEFIRISLHAFCNQDEVARVLHLLS